MSYMKFSEYLDQNKKLKSTGTVKVVPDYAGKNETKPVKESKTKAKSGDFGGKGQDGEPKPYKGGTDAKDPNKGKLTDGFADKGDSKLKYNPADTAPGGTGTNSSGENGVPGGKKAPSWPKTETQRWIDATKNMSLAEFTKTLREKSLKGLDECACQESPYTSIKETISICKCNQQYVSALVREMKRSDMFDSLMKEMVNHPETFQAFAKLIESDEMYARRLVKAMNEMAGPPMGGGMGGMDLGGPMPPHGKKKPMLGHDDMSDDDDMGDHDDDDMDDDDMGDDHDDHDSDDMGDDLGDDSDSDDMDDDGDDLGTDISAGGDDDMGDDAGMAPPPKKHAHDNLLGAMKNHPMMKQAMMAMMKKK